MTDPEVPSEPTPARRLNFTTLELWQQLALGAGALLVIGSFLPWVRITAPFFGTLSRSGIDAGDGWITLLLGAAVIAVPFVAFLPATQKPVALYALGGLALLLTVIEWVDIAGTGGEVEGMVLVSVGIGLYATAVGACVAVAAGVVLQRRTV